MGENIQQEACKKWICLLFVVLFVGSVTILVLHRIIGDGRVRRGEEGTEIQVIQRNSEWAYTRPKTDPGIGNVWATYTYDAGSWERGSGSFSTDEKDGADNYLNKSGTGGEGYHSVFFRNEFVLEKVQADNVQAMTGRIQYKAGVVVSLNGTIIFTGNIPAGGYQSNLEAGAAMDTKEIYDAVFQVTDLSMLREGKNILAVEIHAVDDDEIYFSFSDFSLLQNRMEEKKYDMRNLILTKGENTDEICVNYISDSRDSYRVEYLERNLYKEESDFALYGKTAYMGTVNLGGRWISTVKLERLKENMEYVYRILRVGAKKGTEINCFTTEKVGKSSFVVLPLPTQEEANLDDTAAEWQEKARKAVKKAGEGTFCVLLCKDEFGSRIFMQDTELWETIPVVYIREEGNETQAQEGTELSWDQLRLQYRDMDILCSGELIQDSDCFNGERKWQIGIGLKAEQVTSDFQTRADLICTLEGTGELLLRYREDDRINELKVEEAIIETGIGNLRILYERDGMDNEVSIKKTN